MRICAIDSIEPPPIYPENVSMCKYEGREAVQVTVSYALVHVWCHFKVGNSGVVSKSEIVTHQKLTQQQEQIHPKSQAVFTDCLYAQTTCIHRQRACTDNLHAQTTYMHRQLACHTKSVDQCPRDANCPQRLIAFFRTWIMHTETHVQNHNTRTSTRSKKC